MSNTTDINDYLVYAIRLEQNGRWSLLNRRYAILETIASFDPARVPSLPAKINDQTGLAEFWFYDDSTIPDRSKANLARFEAVLTKAFSGDLPRSARIALARAAKS